MLGDHSLGVQLRCPKASIIQQLRATDRSSLSADTCHPHKVAIRCAVSL